MGQLSAILRNVQGPALSFWCPGCDCAHTIGVGPCGWQWDGNAEQPTFTPSVLVRSHTWTPPVTPENLDAWKRNPWEQTKVETVCHSFVKAGAIQFLGDCTHALANQTVPLPVWPSFDGVGIDAVHEKFP